MSNSPTPQPTEIPVPTQTNASQMQELIALRREKAAMGIYLWNLVRMAAPEKHDVEVSSIPADPLWLLAFGTPSDPNSGNVRLIAGTYPPITEQHQKRVVRLLRGTETPIHEALAQLKLPYPSQYIEDQIKPYVSWNPESKIWDSVKRPTIEERLKNALHAPN